MNRIWILVLVLSASLNVGMIYKQFAPAEGPRDGRDRTRVEGRTVDEIAAARADGLGERLGLDQEQHAKALEIFRIYVPAVQDRRLRLDELRKELRGALQSSEVDEGAFRDSTRELTRVQAQLDSIVAESVLREVAILNPEQRAKYLEEFPRRRSRR